MFDELYSANLNYLDVNTDGAFISPIGRIERSIGSVRLEGLKKYFIDFVTTSTRENSNILDCVHSRI